MTPADQQALVVRVRKLMKRDPARENRCLVQWDIAAGLLAPYMVAARLKSYEAHMIINRARYSMLAAIEAGVPDAHLWIYAMHGARRPAAPHPKAKMK